MTPDVLVVGGGFAGFWAAVAARRAGGAGTTVTLMSERPQLELRPRLYQARPEELAVDIRPMLASIGVDVVAATVTDVDPIRRAVQSSGGWTYYRRMVVATGSAQRRPAVPGAEHAFSVDSQAEAIAFDGRLRRLARRAESFSVVVVGAGFTGLEVALELRSRVEGHSHGAGELLHVVLVDRSARAGESLGPGPRPVIEAALHRGRVEVRPSTTVTRVLDDQVVLADGSLVAADAVVFTVGMAASPFAHRVPGEHDHLGRILVDEHLRAFADEAIFVAGDAAAARDRHGHVVLQSCQHALQLGRYAGENAARSLSGASLLPYAQPPYVTCLDLGDAGAVYTTGWERTVQATGRRAKSIKHTINTEVIHPPVHAPPEELLALSVPRVLREGTTAGAVPGTGEGERYLRTRRRRDVRAR